MFCRKWTKEEDQILLNVVDTLKVGSHILWEEGMYILVVPSIEQKYVSERHNLAPCLIKNYLSLRISITKCIELPIYVQFQREWRDVL